MARSCPVEAPTVSRLAEERRLPPPPEGEARAGRAARSSESRTSPSSVTALAGERAVPASPRWGKHSVEAKIRAVERG